MLHIMGSGNFYGSDMKYENVCEVQGELEGGRNRQDKIRSHFYPKTSFSLLLILLVWVDHFVIKVPRLRMVQCPVRLGNYTGRVSLIAVMPPLPSPVTCQQSSSDAGPDHQPPQSPEGVKYQHCTGCWVPRPACSGEGRGCCCCGFVMAWVFSRK